MPDYQICSECGMPIIEGCGTCHECVYEKRVADLEQRLAAAEPVWEKFNYDGQLDEGIYWFVFESPEYECDEGHFGYTTVFPTGAIRKRIVLCSLEWVEIDGNLLPEFSVMRMSEDRPIEDDEVATHWAPLAKPKFQAARPGVKE